MKGDELYIAQIFDAISKIEEFSRDIVFDSLEHDIPELKNVLQSAERK